MDHLDRFYSNQEGQPLIYRSSAGSGKTFTLTKAYLKLILRDPDSYSQILAITFTNDAKNEMKTRIVRDLTAIAEDQNTLMRQAILDDFKEENVENIESVLTKRARRALDHILHDYSRFHVSTIDHFFSQLIRNLARELNLNLGYELDIDTQSALDESIKRLFRDADQDVLDWLQGYALDLIEQDKGWNIQRGIAELGRKLFSESYLDVQDKLQKPAHELKAFIEDNQLVIAKIQKKVIELAEAALSIATKYDLEVDDFSNKAGGPMGYIAGLVDGRKTIDEEPGKRFVAATTPEKWYTKSSPVKDQIEAAWHDGIGAAHEALLSYLQSDAINDYYEAKAILKHIHSYGVLAALDASLQAYRSEHQLLLISDTARILNKVVKDEDMPFVYEKVGSQFRYILIDEFQDTSKYQWQNLLPFLRNSLADGGQLIIVGDVKQSIYGWRGGDMELLLNQVEKDLPIFEKHIKKLDTNYRSAEEIITFNNAFFQVAPSLVVSANELDEYSEQISMAYADVEQEKSSLNKGYVHIQFFEDEKEEKWHNPAMTETLQWINKCHGKGFAFSDMLILMRTNKEAREMAAFLLDSEIPTISDEALSVDHSQQVQRLLATLKYLHADQDLIAIAEYNYYSGQPVEELNSVPDDLASLQELKSKPVYEIAEDCIIRFGMNKKADIYLQRFLDICLSVGQKGVNTISEFLTWWDEEKQKNGSSELSIGLPENNNAVRLMTVHKAKGLEKPVVFIPFADFNLSPKSNSIFWAAPLPETYETWGSLPLSINDSLRKTQFSAIYQHEKFRQSLEALNLLYVAFTRAADCLFIFSKNGSGKTFSGQLIQQVLRHADFPFASSFDEETLQFTFGEFDKTSLKPKEPELGVHKQKNLPTSLPSEKLKIDDSPSKLFMEFRNEKSNKIREGLLLHEILSKLSSRKDLDMVLNKVKMEQSLSEKQVAFFKSKIETLFAELPEFEAWFDGSWEVINERPIFTDGSSYVPDRVLLKDSQAIVIDYKREKHSEAYENQIRNYGSLLTKMGYQVRGLYLVYINEQRVEAVE